MQSQLHSLAVGQGDISKDLAQVSKNVLAVDDKVNKVFVRLRERVDINSEKILAEVQRLISVKETLTDGFQKLEKSFLVISENEKLIVEVAELKSRIQQLENANKDIELEKKELEIENSKLCEKIKTSEEEIAKFTVNAEEFEKALEWRTEKEEIPEISSELPE